MCHLQGAGSLRTRVFPNQGEDVFVTQGASAFPLINILMKECPESNTGRTSVLGKASYNNNTQAAGGIIQWDISVCNVIGAGGDYVWMPYTSQLFVLLQPISFQMLTVISILTMLMTIVLAHNLEFTLGTTEQPTRYQPTNPNDQQVTVNNLLTQSTCEQEGVVPAHHGGPAAQHHLCKRRPGHPRPLHHHGSASCFPSRFQTCAVAAGTG